jgi:hypothetical protein
LRQQKALPGARRRGPRSPPAALNRQTTMHEPVRFACHAAATDMKNPRHGAAAPCAGVREKRGAGGLNASHLQSKAAEGVRSVAALRCSCGKVVQGRLTSYERLRAPSPPAICTEEGRLRALFVVTARRPCAVRRGRRSAARPSCRPALRRRGGRRSAARRGTAFRPCS